MKTKLFTLFLALVASVGTMFAWDYEHVQIGDLYYNLDATNQTAEVTWQYQRSSGNYAQLAEITIPASIIYNEATYSVTSIGSLAFYDCTSLTSITIPNSVTRIGEDAFLYCRGLTEPVYNAHVFAYMPTTYSGAYILPDGIELIAGGAFKYCSGLTSIEIPNGVTSIGSSAFYHCTSLTSVTIPNSVISIGYQAFTDCVALTSIIIPSNVSTISPEAFWKCNSLSSITVAEDNAKYDSRYNCNAIIESETNTLLIGCKNTIIPNSVTSIGGSAFMYCSGLTSIEIPNGVTSIGSSAFYACTGLTSLLLPDSVAKCGYDVYDNDTSLVTLKFPANLALMDYSSNYAYSIIGSFNPSSSSYDSRRNPLIHIRNIAAPAWFFDIPETHWVYCPKQLEKVVVSNFDLTSDALTVIRRSYKTLKSLDLSGTTNTELADEAVKGLYNLESLKLPTGLTKIGYMAVADCKSLQEITIPASVKEIDNSAFENCRSIKSITFGDKKPAAMPGRNNARAVSNSELQRIGNWAFYNCHELQNLEIPEGVTEIGDGAFYGCTYLEDLSLPASVKSIGDNTFALCAKMKKIVVNAVNPPTIQAKTFFDVKRQIPVYVPDECVDAYKSDTYWKEFNIQGRSNMPTAIDQTTNDQRLMTKKILHNNQILILRGEKTYTLQGQEVR